MTLKINRVGLALILYLTTAFSSNLEPVKTQNEPNVQDGYYYLPPHELKPWAQLTKAEQAQAEKFQYDREKFAQWFIQNNNTPKWADLETNTTK